MDNPIKMTPRDFFLHLGVTIALYVTAGTLLALAFKVIDKAFPKVTAYYYYSPTVSWQVATLIIVFPVLILLSWMIQRQFREVPEKKALTFRRWLIYITLFITTIALIIDLVTVLYFYLDGQDITTGFLLKALAVLVVAGGIFKYFYFDLKGWLTPSKNKLFAIGSAVIILAMIIWGFAVMGSPRAQRLIRIDNQKIQDLQGIQSQVMNHWSLKGAIPASLSELNDSLSGYAVPRDSDRNTDYGYERVSSTTFKLCADFNQSSRSGRENISMAYPIGYDGRNESWQHGAGQHCFDRAIDPTLYPPQKPIR